MALSASAAMDIDLGVIQPHFIDSEHGHHGEGFINFKQVYVVFAPARFLKQLVHRTYRGHGKF